MNAIPRAIVFDLDDTLADTSGTVLDRAHRETVRSMIEAGLGARFEDALHALLEIRTRNPTGDFPELLVERFGASDPRTCAARGHRAFFGTPREGIRLREGALELLDGLRGRGIPLFLLTFGDPAVQTGKIEALGIRDRFAAVRVVPADRPMDKTSALAALLDDRGIPRDRALVVGDRPDGEILAGRTLGCPTVRLRAGEFAAAEPRSAAERADRTIRTLPELLSLLEEPARRPS